MQQTNFIQDFISTLSLPARTNCPICFNKNTFSVSIIDGQIVYNCFHANCKLRGKLKYELSLGDIKGRSNRGNITSYSNDRSEIWGHSSNILSSSLDNSKIPEHWISPLQNPKCLAFMERWKLLELYIKDIIKLWYDPKQDRCVFGLIDEQGVIQGATGRRLSYGNSISYGTNPRWYIYFRRNGACFFSRSNVRGIQELQRKWMAILVEDCISACTVSVINDGISILGTNLPMESIPSIAKYDTVWIALDPDAIKKSFKIQHQLAPYCNSKILLIDRDLKYYNNEQLQKLKEKINA